MFNPFRRHAVVLAGLCLCLDARADTLPVDVDGGSSAMRDNVRLHLSNIDSRERMQPRRLESRIVRLTRQALQALGYYDAQVSVDNIDEDSDTLRVHIEPGEPVRLHGTDIHVDGEGATDSELGWFIRKHAPADDESLNHGDYENFKLRLMRLCRQRGYFDARFSTARIEVDRKQHQARMTLVLDSGVRYRFGKVDISGSSLEPSRTRGFVVFNEGDPYDEKQITDLYKSMLDTAYFRDVNIRHDRDNGLDHDVPVSIELKDNLAHRFNIGAGYGTDSGVRTRFQWSKPLINQYGHSVGATAEFNELKKTVSFDYKIPDGHPAKDYYLAQAAWTSEKIDLDDVITTTYTLSHNHEMENHWVQNLFVKLKQEKGTNISDSYYVTPGFAYSHLELNRPIGATQGHRYLLDTEFSDPRIGSDTQYIKAHGLAKWLVPLAETQGVLIRVEAGSIRADDFSLVPKTSRFFAGGDQSVRGYGFRSLGPQDENGSAEGGRYLSVGSIEHLWRFADHWQWATFVDSGRVFDSQHKPWAPINAASQDTTTDTSRDSFTTGAGGGVRWLSPVGTVSIDLAFQVHNDTDSHGYRLHIYMGPPL